MSKKKSLGSSPIGYSSLGIDSFEFIPSIEASAETSHMPVDTSTYGHKDYDSNSSDLNFSFEDNNNGKESADKKIVSYHLEKKLIERLKRVADDQNMYYSTLVSRAIYCWLENNEYK